MDLTSYDTTTSTVTTESLVSKDEFKKYTDSVKSYMDTESKFVKEQMSFNDTVTNGYAKTRGELSEVDKKVNNLDLIIVELEQQVSSLRCAYVVSTILLAVAVFLGVLL